MLTDEQLEIISEAIQPLFQYLEHEVIVDIARRIKKTLTYTRTAELQAMEMQRLGFSPARIRKEAMKLLRSDAEFRKMVAKNTMEYKTAVRKQINDITRAAYRANDEIVSGAGDMSWVDDLRVWKQAGKDLGNDSHLSQLTEAFSAQTAGELKNLTGTTGFRTVSGLKSIENAYQNELDKSVIKICSGTFSQEKVLRDVVHDLAQNGLRSIDYASGRSVQLDVGARLALRTGCHQLAGKISDANMEQTGENLVYVSRHWGARNTGTGHANHEEWQGKVYFVKPGTDYSEEARRIGQDRIMDLWYATGYSVDGAHPNDPLGLDGYNCRHNRRVWFLGLSSLPSEQQEPSPVTINGKTYDYYAMTQRMRAMERAVRALKREKEALDTLGMDTSEIRTKIRQKTREYREFCRACGVPETTTKMRYECGTADLTKTKAWAKYEDMRKAYSNEPGRKVYFDETKSYRIELEDYPEEVNEGMSIAAKEVAKEGSRTGWEHMRLVNLKTGSVEFPYTDEEPGSVGGRPMWRYLRQHPDEEYAFIHNHNVATELSLTDVEFIMTEKQLPVVVSVRNDGIMYLVESNGKHCNEMAYTRYEREAEEFARSYKDKSDTGQYTRDKELFFRNKVIEEFGKGGMKEYGIS